MLMEQNCIAAITAQEVTIHGSGVIFMSIAFTSPSFDNKSKADIEGKNIGIFQCIFSWLNVF